MRKVIAKFQLLEDSGKTPEEIKDIIHELEPSWDIDVEINSGVFTLTRYGVENNKVILAQIYMCEIVEALEENDVYFQSCDPLDTEVIADDSLDNIRDEIADTIRAALHDCGVTLSLDWDTSVIGAVSINRDDQKSTLFEIEDCSIRLV